MDFLHLVLSFPLEYDYPLHFQNSLLKCWYPMWTWMSAPRKLEPNDLIQGSNKGQVLPWIVFLASSFCRVTIKYQLGCWHVTQPSWQCWSLRTLQFWLKLSQASQIYLKSRTQQKLHEFKSFWKEVVMVLGTEAKDKDHLEDNEHQGSCGGCSQRFWWCFNWPLRWKESGSEGTANIRYLDKPVQEVPRFCDWD